VDDRKNLPEHEALIRRYCATTSEPKSEFTEKKLLYPTCYSTPLRPRGRLEKSMPDFAPTKQGMFLHAKYGTSLV
jgi:hypothetical protein